MASSIQLLRSTIAQERPVPGNLLEGQPAVNLNSTEPGLFFKAADGSLVKFGPAAITSDGSPPNSSPKGSSGNTVGELWLDKSTSPAVLKVYDGTSWVDAGSGGGGGGSTASFLRWIYTALGGETSLSGTSGGVLLDYTPGLEEVFINGVLITRGVDYTATNGTSISNLAALTAGDVVTVLSMNPISTVQLPGQVTLQRWSVLATSGQTVLTGVDAQSQVLAYYAGFEEVYVNGAFLRRGDDYTATDGSSITLLTPLSEDDEVTVLGWSEFQVGNVTTGDIQDGAVTQDKLESGSVVDSKVANDAAISATKLSYKLQPGSQLRTVEDRLADYVLVTDFIPPGTDTETTDCSSYFQNALNYADSVKSALYVPSGRYKFDSGVTIPSFPSGGRSTCVRIIGDGYNSSVLINSSSQYLFTATGDYISLFGIAIDTTTGGGLKIIGDCGGLHIDHFYMNGCAQNFSAIRIEQVPGSPTSGVVYTASITNSRFWRSNAAGYYRGKVLDMTDAGGGITIAIRDCFCSQLYQNEHFVIKNCKNFLTENVQYESGSDSTFFKFIGFNFNATFINTYLEGNWDRFVEVVTGGALKMFFCEGLYAWNYSGKFNSILINVPSTAIRYEFSNLVYLSNSALVGSNFLVDDPNGLAKIDGYENQSTTPQQQARPLTQYRNKEKADGTVAFATVAALSPTTATIQLPDPFPGDYDLSLIVRTADSNHKSAVRYKLIWDNGNAFNFASATQEGSIVKVGSLAVDPVNVTVDNAGLVTISITTQNTTQQYFARYSWTRRAYL